MSDRKEDLERQINLTFAFLSANSYSRKFLTQVWIRDNVGDYKGLTDTAFRKKLQRDLAYLLRVGVPIEQFTVTSGIAEGQQAYRLAQDSYKLPEVEFTPDEAAVLGMAGEMGQNQELGAFARSGWTKLAAGGAQRDLSTSTALTNAGDLGSLSAKTLDAIIKARQMGKQITFEYRRAPKDAPSLRHMDPWGLVPERDRIYLVGFDLDRQEPRTFRITRVRNINLGADATHLMPAGTNLQDMVRAQLRRKSVLIDATLRITPGRAVELRAAGVETPDGAWFLEDVDRDWLVRTAAAHAPEALVIEPKDVIDDVIALLRKVENEVV